jgi:glycerophosphoryl diester phosphodiesterase
MIIAHRGYSQKAQENTISAFNAALKAGAKGIECDIRLTKDKKAIVNHNGHILIKGKKVKISKHTLAEIEKLCKASKQKVLTLDGLFKYIKKTRVQFFLEIKSSSPALVEDIAENIKKNNLWKKVHIIGFSFVVKNALKIQSRYPKLRVGQLLLVSHYSSITRRQKKSYSVLLGWLDGIKGSQAIFRTLMSSKRLAKVKKSFEKKGFRVIGGVINNEKGFKLFREAGITDIVTDRVTEAVSFFKKNN